MEGIELRAGQKVALREVPRSRARAGGPKGAELVVRYEDGAWVAALCDGSRKRTRVEHRDPDRDVAVRAALADLRGMAGVQIDWAGLHRHEHRQKVPLPTYPFEGDSHWIGPFV